MHQPHPGAGELDCGEGLNRRQQYKRQLLVERYNIQVSSELADRLLYVDRQTDQTVITLRNNAGSVSGRVIDKGDTMAAGSRKTNDAEIMAMVDLAKSKGWSQVSLSGTEEFRARAYLAAVRAGLTATGYQPSPELCAQLQKEKTTMSEQAGADGMMALTPDASHSLPASRWCEPLRAARKKLEAERRAVKERLSTLQETDLKVLEMDLAVAHGGMHLLEVRRKFREAAAAAKNAGGLGLKSAEEKKEQAWQAFLKVANKALAVPAAAQRLAEAARQNKEREQLTASLIPLQLGIGEIECLEHEIEKGRDPESEFLLAWRRRKVQLLQPWQELVIVPVFEADAAQERARQQAEAEAADQVKQAQRQEQIKQEMAAQQQADAIQDQLAKPGLTAEQEESLEQQRRYYQALADGNDEEEARDRSKKSNAPRP